MAERPLPPTERPPGWWGVRDSNARMLDENGEPKSRGHEPVRGKIYQLRFDTETFMPEDHARKFLRDEAFLVTDALGEPVASLNKEALKRNIPNDALPANMVIASLEELTQTALMTRCAQRPRAPKFTSDSSRETMIRFLKDEFVADGAGIEPSAAGTEGGDELGDVEDMDESTAQRLLQGA